LVDCSGRSSISNPASRLLWITGASSGIGRATALRFATAGWTVVASARNGAALAALAAEAEGLAGRIVPVPLDVTDAAAIQAAVSHLETDIGPIGLAILNAGTHAVINVRRFETAVFEQLFRLNVLGTANCIAAILPRMLRRGVGEIAIVASLAGYRGLPTAAAYGASKAALINLAEALKLDLVGTGVSARLINPGFVRTPLTDRNEFPMPFLIDAEAAAQRIFDGLAGSAFEIAFPRRFAWMLKFLRILPYRLYFPLVRRFTGS
jgi:short-subunit dehydrogenase